MISLELLARHMAWANQEIYKEVKNLDMESLTLLLLIKNGQLKQ